MSLFTRMLRKHYEIGWFDQAWADMTKQVKLGYVLNNKKIVKNLKNVNQI